MLKTTRRGDGTLRFTDGLDREVTTVWDKATGRELGRLYEASRETCLVGRMDGRYMMYERVQLEDIETNAWRAMQKRQRIALRREGVR